MIVSRQVGPQAEIVGVSIEAGRHGVRSGMTVAQALTCHADLVVLQAADPVEAVRLRATRLHVLRRGKTVAETAPKLSRLDLPGRPTSVDYRRPNKPEIS